MNWEAAHDAITNQDVVKLGGLLSSRKRPMWNDYIAMNDESDSPPLLHMAASVDSTENAIAMMRTLLNSGMDVNVLDSDGKTALMAILETPMDGLLDRALLLLDHDINLNICDKKNNDTVFFVAWRRHIETKEDDVDALSVLETLIERMLDKGIDLCATDSSGRNPLMLICADDTFADSRQLQAILERILPRITEPERSSCLNALDNEGKSVLMHTIDRIKPAGTILALLELSANPFVGDPTGSKVFFRLLRDEPKKPIFVSLTGTEDEDKTIQAITKLVELGCDPKAVDETGETAFHLLAQYSKYHDLEDKVKPLIALLTKWGVDICTTDMLGRTPLMLACVRRKYSGPSRLVDAFLDQVHESKRTEYVNAVDLEGKSTLKYAARSYEPGAIVRRLLELSANPFVGEDPTGSKLFSGLLRDAFVGCPYRYVPEDGEEDASFDGDTDYKDWYSTATPQNQTYTFEVIQKLVDLGCDPTNYVEETSWEMPFHILARSQTISNPFATLAPLLKHLMDWGVKTDAPDVRGMTPLMEVCANNYYRDPWLMIMTFILLVDSPNRTDYVNALDKNGMSALMHAMECEQPGVVALTLMSEFSANPFIGADPTGSWLFLSLLRTLAKDNRQENREVIRMLLDRGFDLHRRTESGKTLLHILAEKFSWTTFLPVLKPTVQYMIAWGADKRAEDNFGRTPYMLACAGARSNSWAIDAFVVDTEEEDGDGRTAFVNKLDSSGRSALEYAMVYENPAGIVLRLLEHSADPFQGDPTGSKLILRLLRKNDEHSPEKTLMVITKLLEMGFDPNAVDASGQTALHHVALRPRWHRHNRNLVTVLLDKGADPTIRDKHGNVAVHYASAKSTADPSIVFLLLQRMTSQVQWTY